MSKKYKIGLSALLCLGVIAASALMLQAGNSVVLNPKGTIAAQQRDLMIQATLLMLIVVIPVFVMTLVFAWRYREGNTKAKYRPEWDSNHRLELIWWGVPLAIILVLAGIIWKTSHTLDPYRAIASDKPPLTIQVVALEWKWLFIYPEHNIASVNYVQFPEDTPINFEITADAPMNSFWIPQLGGQVYAMSGMTTKLHLMADQPGSYDGSSANLSGEGFSGMKFTARSTSQDDFEHWVNSVKQSPDTLSAENYNSLAEPSTNNRTIQYSKADADLFNKIIMKYMSPNSQLPTDRRQKNSEHTHSEGHAH